MNYRFIFKAILLILLISGCSGDSDISPPDIVNPPPPDVITVTQRLQNIIDAKVGMIPIN